MATEEEAYVIEYHRCCATWETIPTPGAVIPLGRCTYIHLDGVRCASSAHVAPGMITSFVPRIITRANIDEYRRDPDDARA